MSEALRVRRMDVWVHRFPLESAVVTSFGVMADRPALFLRLEDADGGFGFGEVWCNFPNHGAEHRARLLTRELSPLLFDLDAARPSDVFDHLTRVTHIHALQAGEPGPYAQAIAGLDMALWDMSARMAGKPVRKLLDSAAADTVPAYASGIHINDADKEILKCRARGHNAFKLKVGFDLEGEGAALKKLVRGLGAGERLFCDANQAWDFEKASRFVQIMGDAALAWLEEPLRSDAPASEWKNLAGASRIPLAAGENIASLAGFQQVISAGSIAFIQPDIAKWGGFTGGYDVARAAGQAGRIYCPHFLGGGIGLIASANLLAAAGGDGLLEFDANPNPLRDAFLIQQGLTTGGLFQLSPQPGLGLSALPEELTRFEVLHQTVTA